MKNWIVVFVVLWMVSVSVAQPCEVPAPPEVIEVGSSHCIQVCPGDFIIIDLQGTTPGPGGVPVLIMQAGCQTDYCQTECTPITPPADLILGGDPFYPDEYFGSSDCLEIYMYWVHDAFWGFEIFSSCEGCFCITYDHQLAVELANFSAVSGDRSIDLNWRTASETDNDYFELWRDGVKIAEVDAATGTSGSTYHWLDTGLRNGTIYHYRLTAVDINGHRQELRTADAAPSAFSGDVTSYDLRQNFPNPFNATTSIAFDLLESGVVHLAVYDLLGRQVANLVQHEMTAGRHVVSFGAGDLPSGMYLYRIDVNGFSMQKKLLLLK
jgi:hypothetical protein